MVGGAKEGENNNEAKLCNVLNLAAGLWAQVTAGVAGPALSPHHRRHTSTSRGEQMRGAALCENPPPPHRQNPSFRQLLFTVLGIMLHTPLFL